MQRYSTIEIIFGLVVNLLLLGSGVMVILGFLGLCELVSGIT